MNFKRKCNNCNSAYDAAFDECPVCHEKNETQHKKFKHLTVLNIWKQIGLFFIGYVGFQAIATIIQVFMIYANGLSTSEEILEFFALAKNSMILNSVSYIFTAGFLFGLLNVDIKKFFTSFKNWKPYVAAIVGLLAILLFEFLYGAFLQITGLKVSVNNNQQTLDDISKIYPFTSIIIFAIIGPICEELTYRVGLFSLTKRVGWWLAYPITIIVFTFIHFDFGVIDLEVLSGVNTDPEAMQIMVTNLTNELLNIPYYMVAAFILSFLYDKFGFASSITLHILNNIISLVAIRVLRGGF